jgi:hypothetical protein
MCVYNALGGDAWTSRTNWNTNAPVCAWFGVTCDGGGAITRLDLRNNNLQGSLPDNCLSNLASLTSMY